ncbi:MAG: DUF4258 domain-containing protein [Candidatus Omnitrophica bacterium]|nr:DUF4258 domain-containing protein [Candidatus Omnitrophota bacterium]
MNTDKLKKIIERESYYFYTHCLTEARKDGISPEDIIYCLLTGKIIEKYPERKRVLIYGIILEHTPLHVVCDLSQKGVLFIVTCYIPDERQWIKYKKRKR